MVGPAHGPALTRREVLAALRLLRSTDPRRARAAQPIFRVPVALRPAVLVPALLVSLAAVVWGGCGPRASVRHPIARFPSGEGGNAQPATEEASTSAGGTSEAVGVPRHPEVVGRPIHMTLYHVAAEPCPDAPQVPMPRCGGGSIGSVSVAFKKSAAMQGTSRLCDGRVVGVQKTNPLCFVVVDPAYPWGLTASGRAATPFRSIAVDPKLFPLGAWYYVPELDGVTLPSPNAGLRHDGCVRADDRGGAVEGDHVDFFVGPRESMGPFVKLIEGPMTMAKGDGICSGDEAFH